MAVLDPNEIMFTAFEPKVQNRFIMYIDGIPSYIIKKISRPSVDTIFECSINRANSDDLTREF